MISFVHCHSSVFLAIGPLAKVWLQTAEEQATSSGKIFKHLHHNLLDLFPKWYQHEI